MKDKLFTGLVFIVMAVLSPLLLPFLLYQAWVHIIALKKKARGLDFNPSASKSG